jgi:kynurenine formamidase
MDRGLVLSFLIAANPVKQDLLLLYENLANLGALPVQRFLFAGFPLLLEGCTGSPVRAVALIDWF